MDGSGHKSMASKNPYSGFATTLKTVDLIHCCIDEVGISGFLRHATCLRTLLYSHMTKRNGVQDWNICKFVTAIEREAGSHLEGLSVSIDELLGSIASGRASMRGFQRLRKLDLPLEIVVCNITAAAACRAATTPNESLVVGDSSTNRHELDDYEPLFDDLIPASVTELSLRSSGSKDHAKALDVMFRDFAARKKHTFSVLDRIILTCPHNADDAYKEQFAILQTKIEKTGVVLSLSSSLCFPTIKWDGVLDE